MTEKILTIGRPNPRQREFLACEKKYVAFGGARGGGKSWAVRTKAKLLALRYPGIRLLLLRRCCFALTVLLTSPALLLFALCPRNTGDVWFLIITIELAVAAILYLRESLRLFISKKISILNWILYLCSVEIFPASLVWLLLAR